MNALAERTATFQPSATAPVSDASQAFMERLMGVYNHAALALMISIGHRTGLFDALGTTGEIAIDDLARRAHLSPRYVREWIGAMYTGGIVDYDPRRQTVRLDPDKAACLTRSHYPNLATSAQWIGLLGSVEDEVVEAFRHGRGVPYSAYHRFHEVMAEESEQTVVIPMMDLLLPAAPGVLDRLATGIDVLDVGCGCGRAINRLAEEFPASRFTGLDFSQHGVCCGTHHAEQRGLNNVRFVQADAAEPVTPASYDLVFAFDAIHDQAKPQEVLNNIRTALRPGGTFFMMDIAGSSHLDRNRDHPVGTFLYTVSCMHCMSVSLANGGPGLGAMWGEETARAMLAKAGFGRVEVHHPAHDPMNTYYICQV